MMPIERYVFDLVHGFILRKYVKPSRFIFKVPIRPTQFIIAANHTSWKDVFALKALDSTCEIMASPVALSWFGVGWFLTNLGCFPAKPGGVAIGLAYLEYAFLSVGICPQGWTYRDLTPFHTGVVRMAHESGIPILPVYIVWAQECRGKWIDKLPTYVQYLLDAILPHKPGYQAWIGEPMYVTSEDFKAETLKLEEAIKELKKAHESSGIIGKTFN